MDTPPPPPPIANANVQPCRQCGYDIKGLSPESVCPECGFPIERSLASDELKNSSPEYIASLHKGVVIILSAIIVMILVVLGSLAAAVAISFSGTGPSPLWLDYVTQGVGVIIGLAMIYGWWLFSAPDPAYTGRADGSTARKVVRVALIVGACVNMLGLVILFLPINQGAMIAAIVVTVLSLIVFGVRYFAEMLYLKWLTPRIPDWDAYNRAKLLIWLGPVL